MGEVSWSQAMRMGLTLSSVGITARLALEFFSSAKRRNY